MAGKDKGAAQKRHRRYRQLSHTADLAWRIWGASLPELFDNAGRALTSTLTDVKTVRRTETREVSVESSDREALLVDWLNRLLYLFDVDGFIGREFTISSLTPEHLKATAKGEIFDPARHPEKTAVKAATFHNLKIEHHREGWQATVVLDL